MRRTLGQLTGADPAALRFERHCARCGTAEHGKPALVADAAPRFSLSHAGDRVVLAVCPDRPVGVDVESADRAIDELRRLVLHPDEPPATGLDLLWVWTRKEALLKATGEGLARPMTAVDLGAHDLGVGGQPFTVHDLATDSGYVAAVATLDGPPADPASGPVAPR